MGFAPATRPSRPFFPMAAITSTTAAIATAAIATAATTAAAAAPTSNKRRTRRPDPPRINEGKGRTCTTRPHRTTRRRDGSPVTGGVQKSIKSLMRNVHDVEYLLAKANKRE